MASNRKLCVCLHECGICDCFIQNPHEAMFSIEIGGLHFPKIPTPLSEYIISGETCSHRCEPGRCELGPGENWQHLGKNKDQNSLLELNARKLDI